MNCQILGNAAPSLIAGIPDSIWVPLAVAVIALAGVGASSAVTLFGIIKGNRADTEGLKRQLLQDSQERAADRLHELRKDVYLRAAAETVAASSYLTTIPALDPTEVNLGDGLQSLMAISAQAQLVSSDDTADAIAEHAARYGEVFMELMLIAAPVHEANRTAKIHKELQESYGAQAQRTLDEMRLLNETGDPDPLKFAALQRSLEFARSQVQKHTETRLEALDRSQAANTVYQVELLQRMERLAEAQLLASMALKKEIGLDTDLERHRASLQRVRDRMSAAMNRLMQGLASAANDGDEPG